MTTPVKINRVLYDQHDLDCPYCGAKLVLKPSPKFGTIFYGCSLWSNTGCRGCVGAHPNGVPLGIPATDEDKKARIAAHKVFDRLWKGQNPPMTRKRAYSWFNKVMQLPPGPGNIGRLNAEQCAALIEHVENFLKEESNGRSVGRDQSG